jgi:glycosyltransferase involved in cell wall biosynthesis
LPADIAKGEELTTPGQKEPIGPCGYYRVKCPWRVLGEQALAEVEYGAWEIAQVVQLLKQGLYDVLVLQRQMLTWQKLLVIKAKEYGVATVYDTDDVNLELSPQNPMYVWWGDNRKRVWQCFQKLNRQHQVDARIAARFTEEDVWRVATTNRTNYVWMLQNADLVTVSTDFIKRRYSEYSEQVAVLPNMIEERDWQAVAARRLPGTENYTVLGWAGGDSHEPDLKMIVRPLSQLFAQRDDLVLVLVGWEGAKDLFPAEMQSRVFTIKWAPIDQYRGWIGGFDIGLAPAVDMAANRAKSSIRVYELALAGVPVVASPYPYGADVHADMGLIANKPIKWTSAIRKYVDNRAMAKQHARALKDHVLKKHTYSANAWRWLQAYEKAVEMRRRDAGN